MTLSKGILSQLMKNKNRGKGTLVEGLEELLKEKMKEMIKEVLEEVAYEEREMFFEENRNKRSKHKTNEDLLSEGENGAYGQMKELIKQTPERLINHSDRTNRKNGFYSGSSVKN